MKCPVTNCGLEGMSMQQRPWSFRTLLRQYRCAAGHRFTTTEAYLPTAPVEKHQFVKALKAAEDARS